MEGNLTFQAGADHPSGYTRVDVVWSDFNFPYSPGTNYWLNFGVRIKNGTSSGQCVDVVYPNPAKDFLTFEIEVPTGAPFVVVEISTGDGKRVLVEKYPSDEEIQTLTIPIGGLPIWFIDV